MNIGAKKIMRKKFWGKIKRKKLLKTKILGKKQL